ncbi:NAD(P)-dependent oxidoreductase [Shewanella youngdeokensis]|uniref:NAD(P)-dependent oxidoreductase n=1 Tax=Shewanella youngdeokensis TaxID=2999068 RepID=A0ABZ0K317_9GAMM|nr:NAD(P)-dependent oxidoreductase [Shewanella sp. DAU334]
MMPLIVSKPLRVLVIGAGKAGQIKLKSALRYQTDVSLMTLASPALSMAFDGPVINADFYQLPLAAMHDYDLIYLAIPWPKDVALQQFIAQWAQQVLGLNKLLCVSCQPHLGNVVNPCSRQTHGFTLTLSGAQMRPRISRGLCDFLARQLSAKLDDAEHEALTEQTFPNFPLAPLKDAHETP